MMKTHTESLPSLVEAGFACGLRLLPRRKHRRYPLHFGSSIPSHLVRVAQIQAVRARMAGNG
jgi:hypothetical protein